MKLRQQKFISAFQISHFHFAFCLVDHRCHYRHEFIGFLFQGQYVRWSNPAFFTQKFQPQRGLIRLLQRAAELGNKFFAGADAKFHERARPPKFLIEATVFQKPGLPRASSAALHKAEWTWRHIALFFGEILQSADLDSFLFLFSIFHFPIFPGERIHQKLNVICTPA
jgi:hypothetical protein